MTTLTDKQQEIRRVRFPASTGPGLLGYSPYASPSQTWEVHMGLRPFKGNKNTEGGHDFEEAIAAAARHEMGSFWERRERPRILKSSLDLSDDTLIDPFHDWLCATPDFIFREDGAAIQVKNHEPHMRHTYRGIPGAEGPWDNNLVPVAYLLQCQFEMIVLAGFTGTPQLCVYLVSHFGGRSPRVYRIRRDERMQATMLLNAWNFWRLRIDPNGPMEPPDDSTWRMRPAEKARPLPKLTGKELLSAPLPDAPRQPASELAGDLFKLPEATR